MYYINQTGLEKLSKGEFVVKTKDEEILNYLKAKPITFAIPPLPTGNAILYNERTLYGEIHHIRVGDYPIFYAQEFKSNCGAIYFSSLPVYDSWLDCKFTFKLVDFIVRNYMMYNGYGVAISSLYDSGANEYVKLGWNKFASHPSARGHSAHPISWIELYQKTNMNIAGVMR